MNALPKIPQQPFQVTCQKLNGDEIVVTLQPGATTVAHVKLGVENLTGMPPKQQQLYALNGEDALDDAVHVGPCTLALCIVDMSAVVKEQENEICRRMHNVKGGKLPKMIIALALQAGGRSGRDILLAMLRPKLEPCLSRLGLNWAAIQGSLASIESLQVLHDAINDSAEDFVLRLVLGDVLPKVHLMFGIDNEDVQRVLSLVSNLQGGATDSQRAKRNAVFDAVMPLVHDEPTMATVEALLVSVLRLDDDVGPGCESAKRQASQMIQKSSR
jgi:hypothetical protein